MKALILGAYCLSSYDQFCPGSSDEVVSLTPSGQSLSFNQRILKIFRIVGPMKNGKSRLLIGLSREYPIIAVVNLGQIENRVSGERNLLINLEESESEESEEEKLQSMKAAITDGLEAIRGQDIHWITKVVVDTCGYPQLVAETLFIADWKLNQAKDDPSRRPFKFRLLDPSVASCALKGRILANGHIMGRQFEDGQSPSLSDFDSELSRTARLKGIQVTIRDREWAETRSMKELSSVSSNLFIELRYSNAEPSQLPIILVGMGFIQYETISECPAMTMNMSAAAVVASTILSLADRNAKVNVIGLIPYAKHNEANKRNENNRPTDLCDLLLLGESLPYAFSIPNRSVITIGLLDGSLTGHQCGWYANDYKLVRLFHEQTESLGDKFFPSWYRVTSDSTCAFLTHFNKSHSPWIHLDITKLPWATSTQLCLSAGIFNYPLKFIIPFIESIFRSRFHLVTFYHSIPIWSFYTSDSTCAQLSSLNESHSS